MSVPVSRVSALWFWEWDDGGLGLGRGQALGRIAEVARLLEVFDWDEARRARFKLLEAVRVLG